MQTCEVGEQCLVIHGHNRPVNVIEYDNKVVPKHACIVNAAVAINQAVEIKGLDHHLFSAMQCYMNGVVIDEVITFLAFILSETMHAI